MLKVNKGLKFSYLLFIFFSISMFCWLLEIIYSLVFRFKFVLPGALNGPWCPIYGVTCVILFYLVEKQSPKWINFIKIYLIATLSEYFASYICDKIFHRTIWDYSEFFLNINGRICLFMSIVFTLMSFIMIYFVEPHLNKIYNENKESLDKLSIVLSVLFIIDLLIKILTKNMY